MIEQIWITSLSDVARIVNVVLSLVALAAMGRRWRSYRDSSRSTQTMKAALAVFTLVAAIGSVENLVHPQPAPGVRPWLIFAALLWTLLAIHLDQTDNHRRPDA